MKKFFFLAIAVMTAFVNSNAQDNPLQLPITEDTKKISYTKVNEMPGISKVDLYKRALTWAGGYYKNVADVLRQQNATEGIIVCKHRFKITNPPDKKGEVGTDAGLIEYTLTINFKEEKYRYTMTDFNWKQKSVFLCEKWLDKTLPGYTPNYEFYLQQLDENAKQIIASFEKGMTIGKVEKKDDW